MSGSNQQDQLLLGFMTSLAHPQRGYVGGLLVTNRFGRPFEFQCTSPVNPNSTQRILYGPTLVPFVLGELIGRTLLEKVGLKPRLVLTDQIEILDLRNHESIPVLCQVEPTADESEASRSCNRETAHEVVEPASRSAIEHVKLGRHAFRTHPDFPADVELARSIGTSLPADANLSEPFGRVREALAETMGINSGAA